MDEDTPEVASTRPTWVRLDGDRWASIRPIEAVDAAALSDFYARLSPGSRRRRFLSGTTSPLPEVIARMAAPAGDGIVAVVASAAGDGTIVGHAWLEGGGEGEAEIGFAVADELQGHGVGRALVRAVVARARDRGLRRLTASMLADNVAMWHLLSTTGFPVADVHAEGGVLELVIVLDEPGAGVTGRAASSAARPALG